jgi:hypothetical protein
MFMSIHHRTISGDIVLVSSERMWPAELQLPLPDIHLWDGRVVAAGRKLPGAQRALPVDCFVGRLASRNTRTGEGAMQSLFRLDVDQVTDVAEFVSEWSGVEDVTLGSPRGVFTRHPVKLSAAGWQQLLADTEASEQRWQASGLPERDGAAAVRSHCAERWIGSWFDGAEVVAQQPVFDDLDTAGIDADLVNKRGNDIYIKSKPLGSRDQQWISPIMPTAVQFRQQRIYLLVIMVDHTTGTVRTRLRERLTDEILALRPSIDLAGTMMSEPKWLDDALPTLRRRIDRMAARVMNRYRPTFFELEPGPRRRPGIVPYTWVALFNDLNAGHVPRICGNTECSAPFTRQVGQAAHGQSRRDATYCSKTCADRAAYLRRRGN